MKRLFIDIPALIESGVSGNDIDCEYFYHRKNPGALSLLAFAEFAVYCRQCKAAFCIDVCPKDALEHAENGMIKRHPMRCVGCKSCVLACPFGTIFPETINYITAKCDMCLEKLQDDPEFVPQCAKSAPDGTMVMKEIEKENPEDNLYFVGDHLAIKSHHWRQKEDKA